MQFRVFFPIAKGLMPSSHSKITETSINGETKTRYRLQGVASTTALDRDNERVSKTCMLDMAKNIKAKRLPIFGNHEHEWENMLGYADNAELIDSEMQIEMITDYEETNPKVAQLIGKLEAGMPLGLSIGGKVRESKDAFEPELGKTIKVIDKVDLLETSIVGIAANPEAYLSLPTQISKSLIGRKEAEYGGIEMFNKSAGQSGEASYGKLGETTPEQKCPECGRPGELREFLDGTAVYLCPYDGTMFKIDAQGKTLVAKPESQPTKTPSRKIDQQVQEPLGSAAKEAKIFKRSDKMSAISKEAEAEAEAKVKRKEAEAEAEAKLRRKDADAEAEAEAEGMRRAKGKDAEAEREAEDEAEAEPDEYEEDETEYKRFRRFMARYSKESRCKAEGVQTAPGGEQAQPKYTIGGSGEAKPVHAKSFKEYETMKKAIKENLAVEGLEKGGTGLNDSLEFKNLRQEMMRK